MIKKYKYIKIILNKMFLYRQKNIKNEYFLNFENF